MMRSGFRSSIKIVKEFDTFISKILSIGLSFIHLPHIYKTGNSVRSGCLSLEKGIFQIIVKSIQKENFELRCFYPEAGLKSYDEYKRLTYKQKIVGM